ncbi:ATP-binding protein [Streptomyces sp. NBC_00481]|uniref:ATP-binding protein n=1 Tax=unclassified Streptomyces TaxID=2593676 RepID=UPI002DD99F68|nr:MULTISPECIES: ATP-binding protein [unclassified Streptomyces]WRZ00241.1 ATP-binding protein [Streptomyces sp. NBC_00481]
MIAAEDIIQTKTADFVGRDYVFTAVEKFIQDHDRGFLVLEGDPGAGKTAILAEYIRRTHCIGHFNLRAQGLNTAGHFVRSLSQQLTARYGAHPAASADGGEAVSHLLREVRAGLPDELPLVIAVDALDETEAAPGAANPLYLPGILDKGVYLVLTTRRNTTTLRADGPFQRIDLKDFHDQTMEDVRRHLENKLSEEALARLVDDSHLSRDAVVARLGEMSEGNFMYLYYTLIDLARSPGLDLDRFLSELPQGLENYYAAHWESMGMAAAEAPTVNAWILYVLCESETPLPAWIISRVVARKVPQADPAFVQRRLTEWRQFLHADGTTSPAKYSLYHASFRDFLHRHDVVANAAIDLTNVRATITDLLWEHMIGDLGP